MSGHGIPSVIVSEELWAMDDETLLAHLIQNGLADRSMADPRYRKMVKGLVIDPIKADSALYDNYVFQATENEKISAKSMYCMEKKMTDSQSRCLTNGRTLPMQVSPLKHLRADIISCLQIQRHIFRQWQKSLGRKTKMIMEQLQEIFRDVFADDAIVLQGTTTSSDIEDWDSLAHIQLISEIENHFGIQFTLQEAVAASNVSEFVQIIESKL